MREIKFRAWDKVCREMFYNSELANGDMMVICLDGEIQLSDDDTYKPDDFILMQYTGLKDKNGKEIYERDITKDPDGNAFEVIWNKGAASFELQNKTSHFLFVQRYIDMFEVIGNTYENPDLLEV